ncbi:MAG: PD40 domain-containing protein [Gemmatimonadetes bacterium]|nr:PD40 domain-containing protein [Gemmatimonadota bacterium]
MHLRAAPRLSALLTLCLLPAGATLSTSAPLGAQGVASLYEPGISPDGAEIAFVSGGDIWTVATTGGAARLLVAHSAHESRPLYSPDGAHLAFNSNRNGGLDVFVMDLRSGDVHRLTHDSGSEELNGWSRDGTWVYFSSSAEDVAGTHDVYRVRASGGTPMAVAADRYEGEYFSAPGPDGLLAISTRGDQARGQWWRNGHSHMDESEIWIVEEASPEASTPTYRPVTTGGKNLWPLWADDGGRLVFMSDRSGAENLWAASASGGTATQLTEFTDGRLLWPSITMDGAMVAFERDFGIWTYDLAADATRRLDVTLLGAIEGPTPDNEEEDSGWSDIAVSPDGEKWAFTAGGDVFAASMSDSVAATRVTDTPAEEGGIVWTPESDGIVYTSWRTGTEKLYHHDFTTGEERALTTGDARDGGAEFSPDGAWLMYLRQLHDERELRVLGWPDGEDRLIARDIAGGATWSPDSRWIAFGAETDEFSNVKVAGVEGGEPRQVSFMASSSFGSLRWSADGTYLVYRTAQRTEPGELIKVDLVPAPPAFDEDAFRELFNDPEEDEDEDEDEDEEPDAVARSSTASSGGPVDVPDSVAIDFDGIRRRGGVVSTSFSVGSILLHPDGKSGVVTGEGGLRRITFGPNGAVDFDEMSAQGNPLAFSENGRQLYTSRGGQLRVVAWPGGSERTVSTSVDVVDDFERTKLAAFEQGWGEMRDGFYDPDYHGTDWDAVRDAFRPQIEGARTRAEFGRLMDMMLGELNASHLGHSGRTGPPQGGDGHATGRVGLRFDRIAYEAEGRFVVTEVLELGPADVAGEIEVGAEIVSVDGTGLDADADLHLLLRDAPGRQVVLGVASGGTTRDVEVLATSAGAEAQLVYRNWVESRRAYVDAASGGRLGYVHIPSMSSGSLTQFIRDLDQLNHAKDGVVIDVRDNNGGFVNVYAIDVLARRNYFTMESRGSDVLAPSRVRLGQRALLAPTVLVTNQNTLSDGEDFTEGYRELELGSVVGEPTAGWIIFTGSRRLVDGTTVRMPGTFIRDNRGQNMELNPRPVDVEVERPAGEHYQGIDSQLDAAVRTLLGQIDGR